jgi:hypothetical protein
LLAPLGSDTFTVKLYDGQNATGNLLSTGAVTQTISIDQANSVSVTFNGAVSALSVALNPSSVASGASASVGVTVNALDADGNTIVAPGIFSDQNGNPVTVTLSDSDASGATQLSVTTLTQPTSGITLSYNGAAISSPTISASAPGFGSAKAALTVGTGTILLGTVVQSANVVLPAGSSLTPSSLTVKNSLALVSPAANGSFGITQFAGGPQFAFVTDPSGEAILAGFIGPGSTTIDATSTAKVLLYWSTGFFTLPSPLRALTIDDLANQPGFNAVRDAFAASLSANPDPFSSAMNRLNVVSAITSFTKTLYMASAGRHQIESVRWRNSVGVSPSSALSGIVTLDDFPAGLHFMNAYRRVAEAFIDEDSYVDSQGNRVTKQVLDAVAPVHIAAVSSLNNITGGPVSVALNLLGGTTPYTPVTTPSVSLPLEPGSQSTRYHVTVVGPGASNASITLTQEQSNAQQSLVVEQLVQDYLVPLVASITIPVNASQIDAYLATADGGAQLANIATMAESAAPQLYPVANSGQVGDALTLALDVVAASPTLQNALFSLVGNLISSTAGTQAGIAFQNGYSPLYGLDVLSAVILSNDTAVASANIAASNGADLFVADVTTDSVTLTPLQATIPNTSTEVLTASAPTVSGQTIQYQWANTATSGHITDGTAGHTDNFTSSSNTVTYTAQMAGNGNDTVTVTAFAVLGQNSTQIGSPASAAVTVGVCRFAGTFSGPLTDGRFSPPLVSTYTITQTCSPPNNIHTSWSDPSYGTGAFGGTYSGLTVTVAGGVGTQVYSADYNTINASQPDAMQSAVLTRTSGP